MKKANIVPIIGISFLVFVFLANVINSRNARPLSDPVSTEVPPAPTMVVRRYSEGEITAAMERKLGELYPDHFDLSRYMSGSHSVVDVRTYSDSVAALRDLAAAKVADMPDKWEALVASYLDASKSWSDTFKANGIEDVMVQFSCADPARPDEPCFTVVNGILVYDPVRGVDLMGDIRAAMGEAAG